MAQVRYPQRQAHQTSGSQGGGKVGKLIGTTGGAIIGSVGGGAGALAGASAGGGLGEFLGETVSPTRPPQIIEPDQTVGTQAPGDAMGRRMQAMQQDPLYMLKQAEASLPEVPPLIQAEYGPIIQQALAQSRGR